MLLKFLEVKTHGVINRVFCSDEESRNYLVAAEREIQKHVYLESEKAHSDLGERAEIEWTSKYEPGFFQHWHSLNCTENKVVGINTLAFVSYVQPTTESLISKMSDPDVGPYAEALLVKRGKEATIAILKALATSTAHLERTKLIRALSNTKDARSVRPLIICLNDPHYTSVFRQVVQALTKITGKNFKEAVMWKRWLNEQN